MVAGSCSWASDYGLHLGTPGSGSFDPVLRIGWETISLTRAAVPKDETYAAIASKWRVTEGLVYTAEASRPWVTPVRTAFCVSISKTPRILARTESPEEA
jgi:hypothetical protein